MSDEREVRGQRQECFRLRRVLRFAFASAVGVAALAPAQAFALSGTVDDASTWSLSLANERFRTSCSSVLILPNLILTARHCVDSAAPKPECGTPLTEFAIGEDIHVTHCTNARGPGCDWTQGIKVYRPETTEMCGFDVAAVVLRAPVLGASIAEPDFSLPVAADRPDFSIAAFGAVDAQQDAWGIRRRVDALSVLCIGASCGTFALGGPVAADEFITSSAGLCDGDSGGPAFLTNPDGTAKVIGIVSRGGVVKTKCEGGLFSRLGSFRTLISAAALDAASRGGYAAPGWATETMAIPCQNGTCAADAGTDPPPPVRGPVCTSSAPVRCVFASESVGVVLVVGLTLLARRRRKR